MRVAGRERQLSDDLRDYAGLDRDVPGHRATRQQGSGRAGGKGFARALGWLSIGLGVADLAAPQAIACTIGLGDQGGTHPALRVVGAREITSGLGILSRPRPVGWVWTRVAGDAMDLTLLGRALVTGQGRPDRLMATIAALAGITALDLLCGIRLGRAAGPTAGSRQGESAHVKKAVTIRRSPEDVYRFWRDFRNLPRFMSHLEAVEVTGDGRSHWRARAPAGQSVEWDAEIVEDRPHELIAWRSLEGSDVANSGQVRFRRAPCGQGAEVVVDLRYDPPAGRLGQVVAKLLGEEPGEQVADDLRRLKEVLETGEVLVSDATVEGGHLPQRPAQPPRNPVRSR